MRISSLRSRVPRGNESEPVRSANGEHLLVVEDRLEAQLGLERRGRRDEEIDLVAGERSQAAELHLLLHVDLDLRKGDQER